MHKKIGCGSDSIVCISVMQKLMRKLNAAQF